MKQVGNLQTTLFEKTETAQICAERFAQIFIPSLHSFLPSLYSASHLQEGAIDGDCSPLQGGDFENLALIASISHFFMATITAEFI